jgi:predicted lipoprotein with Yx(FWY)xxD motif
MKGMLIPIVLVAGVAMFVVALTLGGGTGNANKGAQTGSASYGGTSAKPSPAAAATAIDVRKTPLGKILVDGNGRTLYLFEADKPNMSNCSGPCLSIWPAFTSNGKPQAKGGAVASKIGTVANGTGEQQVTYNGHPLYYYAADKKPGDATGEGLNQFGAIWDVIGTNGNGIDNG